MSFLSRFKAVTRKHFLTGLLIFIPISLTVFLVDWLDTELMSQITKLPPQFNPNTYLPFRVPGLGVILTLIIIYIVGFIGSNYMGRWVVSSYESLLEKIPGVRWLYVVFKQLMEAVYRLLAEVHGKGSDRFRGVVLLEYPRRGIYSLAFVTGDTRGEVQEKIESKLVNVFLPTTPNPTSGFYLMVPSEQLIPLDLSVEQAFRMIMSAGMVGEAPMKNNKQERQERRDEKARSKAERAIKSNGKAGEEA